MPTPRHQDHRGAGRAQQASEPQQLVKPLSVTQVTLAELGTGQCGLAEERMPAGHLHQPWCQGTSNSRHHHPPPGMPKPQDGATQAAPAPSNQPRVPCSSQTSGTGQSQDGHSIPTAAFGTEPCRHCCPGRDLITTMCPGYAAGLPSSKHLPPLAPVLGVTSHWNRNPHPRAQSKAPLPGWHHLCSKQR